MRSFLVLTCRLPAENEDRLTQLLEELPVLGCQVEDARPDIVVSIFFDSGHEEALTALSGELLLLDAREMVTGPFADRDWLEAYRRHAKPMAVGERIWLDPNPVTPTPPPEGRLHLLIEPRNAFGTGSHESTRLLLEVLDRLDLTGLRVLDVGCGSGILALAACGLGAAGAIGFDIDLEAVFVARQTVAVQPRPLPVRLFAGSVEAIANHNEFDLILANLIPAEVTPFLANLAGLLAQRGKLVLSGLMADQRQAVESDLRGYGLRVEKAFEIEEWVALQCVPA
ncbi:MAG TPA: 50S ribosomal protein L11 methyltransferase [Thermoanaerobaculaceae bacterium]|nr:50S ribosomal protein L11 methyltransferase [Acidobacteriota bacterium]NLH11802.1 methyltransferase domain-containing protein [Holophagae bacterium]HPW56346.1 50S ribosomal protein L11 methyltransferase [Thermoanaerobaculaceae bacterium]